MKKIISSLIALAMFVSVATVFTGCGKVSGKEYETTKTMITVITELTEEGKVKTTRTFTGEEYLKLTFVWEIDAEKTIEEALAYELSEDEQKALNEMTEEMLGEMQSTRLVFGKDSVKSIDGGDSEGSTDYEYVMEGTYTIEDDVIYITSLITDSVLSKYGFEDYKMYATNTTSMKINEDGSLTTRMVFEEDYNDAEYEFTAEDVFSAENVEAVYYVESIFTEVK